MAHINQLHSLNIQFQMEHFGSDLKLQTKEVTMEPTETPNFRPDFKCQNCHAPYVIKPEIFKAFEVPFLRSRSRSRAMSVSTSIAETESRELMCEDCSIKFSAADGLKKHNERLHTTKLFICALCKRGKRCTKVDYLSHLKRRHEYDMHAKAVRQPETYRRYWFPCIFCREEEAFVTFEELEKHLKEFHDRRYVCNLCSMAYMHPYSLVKHEKKSCKWKFGDK